MFLHGKHKLQNALAFFAALFFCIEIHLFEQANVVETEKLGKPKRSVKVILGNFFERIPECLFSAYMQLICHAM